MSTQPERHVATSDGPFAHVIGVALYTLLAFVSTWPLLAHATSRLPLGTEQTRTVPLFNAWTIWWNADRLARGGHGYWNAPIFYPERNTFAFSEPQPMTMLVAPVIWTTGSRVLAYNVYLWLALILNGWLTQILLRYLGLRLVVAIGAGVAMVLLPVVHWQIGVLQLVPLAGILWTWLAFAKIATPKIGPSSAKEIGWRGCELGLAFATAFFISVHHALFLAVLMVAGAWTLGKRVLHAPTLATLLVAVLLAGLLTSPILLHLHRMTSEHHFTRTREVVEQLSLQIRDYGAVYGHTFLGSQASDETQKWLASPGWLKLVWAGLGIGWGLLVKRYRTWTWFLVTTGLMAFVLSLGAHLNLAGWQPWYWLTAYVPGFAQVRSAFRFVYFVQLVLVLAAAQGIDGAWDWISSRRNRRAVSAGAAGQTKLLRAGAGLAAIMLCIAAVVDPWPLTPRLGVVPEVGLHRDWISVLKASPEPGAVLCLPMAAGDHVRDFETTTEWMLLGTYHGRPLVNGYSGFFPARYFKLRAETWSGQLSNAKLEEFYREGIRFIVVDRRRYTVDWQDERQLGHVTLKRIQSNPSGIELYRLSIRDH